MREIVLDTETTGTDAAAGDRVIEIGCVELVNQFPTGRTFHAYINPKRAVSQGAFNVHGLSEAFLAGVPPSAGAFLSQATTSAPPGGSPVSAHFHSATSSFRDSATIPTFLDRAFPPANRDAYHRLSALSG